MPKISVIVPVYNVEQYLHECIESIVRQSYGDFELILVDDGSSDASGSICDKAAGNDERITVIHKPNEGVSIARNVGIESARSEWITFVDSDDIIEEDYLENLYRKAQQQKSDLVTSGILFDYGEKQKVYSLEDTTIKSFEKESDFVYMITQELITSPVGKLYKRDIIIENDLRFDPLLSFGEDRDFNIRYLNATESACSTSYVGYNYRIYTPGSLTKKNHPQRFKNDYKYWTKLKEFTHNRGFSSLTTEKMLTNRLFHLVCDEVMMILRKSVPLLERIHLLKNAFSEIDDFSYLMKNKSLIDGGNGFLKRLILYRQSTLLALLAVFYHGNS